MAEQNPDRSYRSNHISEQEGSSDINRAHSDNAFPGQQASVGAAVTVVPVSLGVFFPFDLPTTFVGTIKCPPAEALQDGGLIEQLRKSNPAIPPSATMQKISSQVADINAALLDAATRNVAEKNPGTPSKITFQRATADEVVNACLGGGYVPQDKGKSY